MQVLVAIPGKDHAEKLSGILPALGAERIVQTGLNSAGAPNGKPILDAFRESLSTSTGSGIFWTAHAAPWGAIQTLLEEGQGRRALVFYEAADLGVARQLQAGVSAQAAIGAWSKSAAGQLEIIENKSEQVTLVRYDHALLSPGAFVQVCSEAFKFDLADTTVQPELPSSPGRIFRIAAEALLQRMPEVAALDERLASLANPLASSSPLSLDDIDRLVADQRALHADRYNFGKLKTEADALRKAVQSAEFSAHALRLQLNDREAELRLSGASSGMAVSAQARDFAKDLEREAQQLRKVLVGVQEVAEQNATEISSLQASLAKERHQAALLREENRSLKEQLNGEVMPRGQTRRDMSASPGRPGAMLPESLRNAVRRYRPDLWLRMRADVRLVEQSGLFDATWYADQNADVREQRADPVKHFVRHGGQEGRSPGPAFCSARYLRENADVARAGVNPLVHYVRLGKSEGRKIYRAEVL